MFASSQPEALHSHQPSVRCCNDLLTPGVSEKSTVCEHAPAVATGGGYPPQWLWDCISAAAQLMAYAKPVHQDTAVAVRRPSYVRTQLESTESIRISPRPLSARVTTIQSCKRHFK